MWASVAGRGGWQECAHFPIMWYRGGSRRMSDRCAARSVERKLTRRRAGVTVALLVAAAAPFATVHAQSAVRIAVPDSAAGRFLARRRAERRARLGHRRAIVRDPGARAALHRALFGQGARRVREEPAAPDAIRRDHPAEAARRRASGGHDVPRARRELVRSQRRIRSRPPSGSGSSWPGPRGAWACVSIGGWTNAAIPYAPRKEP